MQGNFSIRNLVHKTVKIHTPKGIGNEASVFVCAHKIFHNLKRDFWIVAIVVLIQKHAVLLLAIGGVDVDVDRVPMCARSSKRAIIQQTHTRDVLGPLKDRDAILGVDLGGGQAEGVGEGREDVKGAVLIPHGDCHVRDDTRDVGGDAGKVHALLWLF